MGCGGVTPDAPGESKEKYNEIIYLWIWSVCGCIWCIKFGPPAYRFYFIYAGRDASQALILEALAGRCDRSEARK